MLQIENIQKIDYLKNILQELHSYSIPVQNECQKLHDFLLEYQEEKKKEMEEKEQLYLNTYGNPEIHLSLKLMQLEMDLEIYILFLKLYHLTDDWDVSIQLDSFEQIENKLEQILIAFGDIERQREIYKRYHHLVWKKILQDTKENRKETVFYYEDLEKFPYLIKSIQSYGKENGLSLPNHLENYRLDTILEEYIYPTKDDIVLLENDELEKKPIEEKDHSILPSFLKWFQKILHLEKAKIEISQEFNTNDVNEDLKWIKDKDFSFHDFRGMDLANVDFTDAYLACANFQDTHAHIDPQKIKDKNLYGTNLEGLDLSQADFTDVYIRSANLFETHACIDPQRIREKDLCGCNLKGLNFIQADFTGVNIFEANLAYTGATIHLDQISLEHLRYEIEKKGNLAGCFVVLSDNPIVNAKFDYHNAVLLKEKKFTKIRMKKEE